MTRSNGQVKAQQTLSSESRNRVKGHYIQFTFWFKSNDDSAKARIEWTGGSAESDWIGYSSVSGNDWVEVRVRTTSKIPSTVSSISVFIIADDYPFSGSRSIDSKFDDATLEIIETAKKTSSYGDFSLVVKIWTIQSIANDRRPEIDISVDAKRKGSYYVSIIEFTVELEPQGWVYAPWPWIKWGSTQNGKLFVQYAAAANDIGWNVNPAQLQQNIDQLLTGASTAWDILSTVGQAGAGLGQGASVILGLATPQVTNYLFDFFGSWSTLWDTNAFGQGRDGHYGDNYFTHVAWIYTNYGSPHGTFPTRAEASHILMWYYLKNQPNYALKITASVTWGQKTWNPERLHWYLRPMATSTYSMRIYGQ